MKTLIQLQEANFTFVQNLWSQFLGVIPKILMAIGFVLLALIILKVVNYILKKLLKLSNIDSLTTKLNEAELFGKNDYDIIPSKILLKFPKYINSPISTISMAIDCKRTKSAVRKNQCGFPVAGRNGVAINIIAKMYSTIIT